jgi:predicted nucleotidyltransferase
MEVSKFGTFRDYPKESLPSAEAALLTAWKSLERYHDDLVLVGGLAVHYLTRRDLEGLPDAVTMDVDFGITLAASGGQYGTIKSDLAGLGFVSKGNRLVRQFGNLGLYLDFLTEDPPAMTGSRTVDDVVATVVPGLNRALRCRRMVAVRGRDLYGAEQNCRIAVADIGPLLVLKINAFGGPIGRRHPKDAYDILLAVTRFVDGPEAAVTGFRAEANADNTGYPSAIKALLADFSEPNQDGPIRAAEFHSGNDEDRARIRQDVATVGKILLGK